MKQRRPRLKTLPPRVPMIGPSVRAVGDWSGRKHCAEYYGHRWKMFRAAWLAAHPLCGDRETGPSAEHSQCVRDGRVTAAAELDHVTPHGGNVAAFWRGPYQSLCRACHRVKTEGENRNANA